MLRAFLPIFLAAVALAFWVYTIIDCVRTEAFRVRGLPKPVWVLVVIVLPLIGGLLWFIIGRGRNRPATAGGRPLYADDDPDFLNRVNTEREREERIRDLEEKLAELDDDSDDNSNNKPQA